ncbi:MAG: carboxypeptidase regulatory-like domain-containing protein [Bryobacterales bacterium]|nr:carboxypeptidase regulatory-like domain-containing protein [Bryobacterales bacterium]
MLRFSKSVFVWGVLLMPGGAWAQTAGAALTGRVADAQGQAMRDVKVEALRVEAGTGFSAVTNENGAYRIASLPVGRYVVRFALAGFQSVEVQDVELHVGQERPLDARLAVAGQRETLTVTAPTSALDTQASAASRTVLVERAAVAEPGIAGAGHCGWLELVHRGQPLWQGEREPGRRVQCERGAGAVEQLHAGWDHA